MVLKGLMMFPNIQVWTAQLKLIDPTINLYMYNYAQLNYTSLHLVSTPSLPTNPISKKWEGNVCHQEAAGVVHALLHNPWNCHCTSWVHHFDKSQGYSLRSSGDSGSSVAEYRWWWCHFGNQPSVEVLKGISPGCWWKIKGQGWPKPERAEISLTRCVTT